MGVNEISNSNEEKNND